MTSDDIHGSIEAPVLKRDLVLEQLRTLIVTGELKPGRRMPTRSTIKNQFKTGGRLVDEVFEQLEEDGFVYTEPSHGTYVAEHPPHLCHYAVVLSASKEGSAFDVALKHEAEALLQAGTGRLLTYADVVPGTAEYKRLIGDMNAHRVAGLIFRQPPLSDVDGTPLLTMPGIPRVVIATVPYDRFPSVRTDYTALVRKAVAWLAGRGRRRLAFLSDYRLGGKIYSPSAEAIATKGGLVLPSSLFHVIGPYSACSLVRMMMQLPEAKRPDALIVDDDNLVEQASLGLADSGVRVGRDMDVVGHCNFPYLTESHVPMKRIGWDNHELLRACMAQIDRMRAGETNPPPIVVEPLFDHEMQVKANGKAGRKDE